MITNPETDLVISRSLKPSPAQIWQCWTTPEYVKQFMVPKPHTVTECEIDLRVGGRFNSTFLVEGNEMKNEGVFLEIIEHKRLAFTDFFTEGWKPSAEPFMTAIVEFDPNKEGGTELKIIVRHRTKENRENHENMGFFDGWNKVIDQLEQIASTI